MSFREKSYHHQKKFSGFYLTKIKGLQLLSCEYVVFIFFFFLFFAFVCLFSYICVCMIHTFSVVEFIVHIVMRWYIISCNGGMGFFFSFGQSLCMCVCGVTMKTHDNIKEVFNFCVYKSLARNNVFNYSKIELNLAID